MLLQPDKRKQQVLCCVIDEYINTGEPVGSNIILKRLPINVSSATVRNDMAELERQGFLVQPHTSAGRVPTYEGYRYYIDNLMCVKPLTQNEKCLIDSLLGKDTFQTADTVVETAVDVLSELTELAVVSKSNMPIFSVITRVEVIPAGRRLYALLIITSAGAIKNKICRVEFDLSHEQIDFFAKFINKNLTGLNMDKLNSSMLNNLAVALGTYMLSLSPLLHAVYELSEEMLNTDVNLKGEQRLLVANSFNLTEIASLLTHKNELTKLLLTALDGISVVFGKENESFAISNSSMIVSPYKLRGQTGGSFGVIGPIRVDYAKVIPHIEYISNSVTKLLSNAIEYDREDD